MSSVAVVGLRRREWRAARRRRRDVTVETPGISGVRTTRRAGARRRATGGAPGAGVAEREDWSRGSCNIPRPPRTICAKAGDVPRRGAMTYDAIVIGAGHNGLAAAIHLAAKGWKVGVFERNGVAGGAVQTARGDAAGLPPRSLRDEPRACSPDRRSSPPMARRSAATASPSPRRPTPSPRRFPTDRGSASAPISRPRRLAPPRFSTEDGERWREMVDRLRQRRAAYLRRARLAHALVRAG